MQAALGIDVRPIGLGQMPAFQGGRGGRADCFSPGHRLLLRPTGAWCVLGVSGEGARYE